MTETITAVVREGRLEPLEPVDLPDGETVELRVVRVLPQVGEAELREMDEDFGALWAEAAQLPSEWWDEFNRSLQENRMNFPERVFPES